MARTQHGYEQDHTEDGWGYSRCLCGWVSPLCPETETVFGLWNEHIRAEFARVDGKVSD